MASYSCAAADEDRHSADVSALTFYGDRLYSGADDGRVKVSYCLILLRISTASHSSSSAISHHRSPITDHLPSTRHQQSHDPFRFHIVYIPSLLFISPVTVK